jgi:hypothetical protein
MSLDKAFALREHGKFTFADDRADVDWMLPLVQNGTLGCYKCGGKATRVSSHKKDWTAGQTWFFCWPCGEANCYLSRAYTGLIPSAKPKEITFSAGKFS